MTTRLDTTFATLKAAGHKALVGYITAGDPDFDTSLTLLRAACDAGLDVLELGIPFSDPTSDGPVIQAAALRALKSGMTVARVLKLVRELRRHTETPIILFSYYNPLLSYGLDRLAKDAASAGADGFLVVDLPPEEAEEFAPALAAVNMPLIRLIAPTTPPGRMRLIAQGAGGFLYVITRTGVTGAGAHALDPAAIRGEVESVRRASGRLPICLGFGIRTADDVRALAPMADGLVVGSALMKIVEEHAGKPDLPQKVASFIRELKQGL